MPCKTYLLCDSGVDISICCVKTHHPCSNTLAPLFCQSFITSYLFIYFGFRLMIIWSNSYFVYSHVSLRYNRVSLPTNSDPFGSYFDLILAAWEVSASVFCKCTPLSYHDVTYVPGMITISTGNLPVCYLKTFSIIYQSHLVLPGTQLWLSEPIPKWRHCNGGPRTRNLLITSPTL
jgi:hypothetical protein